MKKAQLIGIAIAGVCAVGAFVGMRSIVNKPAPVVVQREVNTNTVEVLVAKSDIGLGSVTSSNSFRWQQWPQENLSPSLIVKRPGGADPMSQHTGAIAKSPIMAGEPITKTKLIKAGEGGVLAAILPPGKRAISVKIAEDSAVGRLILPNDHVDVINVRRVRGRGGQDTQETETIFRNIRVLAIGQLIETKEGKKHAEGNTATLELTPTQAERLALAKSSGEIALTLRSIADLKSDTAGEETEQKGPKGSVRIMRYGVPARSSGLN